MKRIITFLAVAGLVGAVGQALAQGGPGPGGGTNDYDWNNSYSNYYAWGTNLCALSNAPAPNTYSNKFSHAYAGQTAAGGGGQVQSRFGQQDLPADVQTMVQQFQQDRVRLMSQLKTASDEQRKLILRDMEQLRTQLRDQVCKLRDQCQQQAEQMRNRFGNNRDPILDQGAAGEGTGRGR